MKKSFPFYKQPDAKDCGPTCLRIISKYYGKTIPLQRIRNLSETTREGSSLLGISEAAENLGFRSLGVQIDFNTLVKEVPLPCIVHWNKQHFVVVYGIKTKEKRKTTLRQAQSNRPTTDNHICFRPQLWVNHLYQRRVCQKLDWRKCNRNYRRRCCFAIPSFFKNMHSIIIIK